MTLYVPLGEQKALPPTPSFLREPADHETAVSGVVKAIMKAKRIIVVCGEICAAVESPWSADTSGNRRWYIRGRRHP